MSRIVPVTALILAGALGIARADVFRWVDPQGVIHYSDEWVPGSVLIKTSRPHPDSGGGPTASNGNRMSEDLGDDANSRAVQQDMAKARDTQCKIAKDRYMKAIESRRVYKESKDGERQYLSDTDADAYREQARKDVQDRCGSVPEYKPDQPIPEPQAIPEPKPIPEPNVKPEAATSPQT